MARAVVVGGGIAGLLIARDLAVGGMNVTLFEATGRLGGKAVAHTVAGVTLDAGAESFANRGGSVAALARELGLDVVAPLAAGAWLMPVSGAALPLPAASFLGIPGTPLADDVVAVVGREAAKRAETDSTMGPEIGSDELTLGGLVRARMGEEILEGLVAPVVTGIHSRHPDDLDLDLVAPGLRAALAEAGSLAAAVRTLRAAAPAGSAVSGIVGGIHRLIDRLDEEFRRAGGRVEFGSPVSTRLDADVVVLAAPPELHAPPTIALVTLVVDSPALDGAPRGTGLLVAAGAGVHAKALTHSTAKWPWLKASLPAHRHVIRLSYNAPFPEGLEEQARADAEALLGVRLAPESIRGTAIVTWPAVPPRPAEIPAVTVIGESVAGTGLASVVSHTRREAERLLQEVES